MSRAWRILSGGTRLRRLRRRRSCLQHRRWIAKLLRYEGATAALTPGQSFVSFSAVSALIFESTYGFFRIFWDLQYYIIVILHFASMVESRNLCKALLTFHQNRWFSNWFIAKTLSLERYKSWNPFGKRFEKNLELWTRCKKGAHIVELDKCCKTHTYSQKSASIQPRMSPPKIGKQLRNNWKIEHWNFATFANITVT